MLHVTIFARCQPLGYTHQSMNVGVLHCACARGRYLSAARQKYLSNRNKENTFTLETQQTSKISAFPLDGLIEAKILVFQGTMTAFLDEKLEASRCPGNTVPKNPVYAHETLDSRTAGRRNSRSSLFENWPAGCLLRTDKNNLSFKG